MGAQKPAPRIKKWETKGKTKAGFKNLVLGIDSFESVASASLHTQGVQHHSHDADPDIASSAAPAPAHDLEFDHEVDDDFDHVFPPEHDPVHDDAPAVAPFVDDIPIANHPVVAPPLVDDHVIDAPLLIEDPVVAPFPDPMPVPFDRAPFATHIDPRCADSRNGWIDDDDDYPPFVRPVTPPVAPVLAPVSAPISTPTDIPLVPPHTTDTHRTDLPVTFLQDIPPPRPGEGSSREPPVPAPPMLSSPFPFTSQFPTVAPSTSPYHATV
ncbi:non-classical arabinogalactan protein 31-like [Helianthus annuus]|uniref:non-classical arabinogalactan protein 31-like n=1 Tax=Helianthus annuus TaxID=4232 RepID=UPI000B908901|nr:non-classical arabinogalactan protein 31-like [Helianthus annuus]